jgi:hypothetical protein
MSHVIGIKSSASATFRRVDSHKGMGKYYYYNLGPDYAM